MLDKTLPYVDYLMHRPVSPAPEAVPLPAGFRFVFFKAGDEAAWAHIETSVGE